jgi:DNA-binding HxlR family transcriptional regulator
MRSYADPCGIARALDAVGERWALLVVRELTYGPKRFVELQKPLALAKNVLAQRLRDLQRSGVVRKTGTLYELTDWGRDLHPVLLRLGRWGARSPNRPRGELTPDALMVALESTFVAAGTEGLRAIYEVRLGEARFAIEVEDGEIFIARGAPMYPYAVIETDAATFRAVVFGDRRLEDAKVRISGDEQLGRRLFRLFQRQKRLE